jgi:hypothetical protein
MIFSIFPRQSAFMLIVLAGSRKVLALMAAVLNANESRSESQHTMT